MMYPKPKLKRKNKKISDNKRYSILVNDLTVCVECGRHNINKHEVFGGKNRNLSKKYGLIIPLCQELHHNQYDCKGIHFDKELSDKWHKIAQNKFEETHTREEFIQIFGKNYL